MASKKQRADAAKKKEKRTKIIAIGGCLLLLAVGGYEIPSMLAVMNKKPPPSTYDPGPSTGSPLPDIAAGTTPAAPPGALVDTDIPPPTGAGQLVSFEVFQAKNPFAPQVSATPDATTAPAAPTKVAAAPTTADKVGADVPAVGSTTAATPNSAPRPAAVPTTAAVPTAPPQPPVSTPAAPAAPTPSTTDTPSTTTTTTTTTPVVATAAISVNGVVSHVTAQGTFPSGAPVFRLVRWTKDTAEVGIVGGSYETGAATLTLEAGESVTLQNQSDGKRYRLELLSAK